VKPGGTLIVAHPCTDEFDPVQHPSYIEFFHRLLPETRDAVVLERKYEREFAENPSYVHMYRTGNAYIDENHFVELDPKVSHQYRRCRSGTCGRSWGSRRTPARYLRSRTTASRVSGSRRWKNSM